MTTRTLTVFGAVDQIVDREMARVIRDSWPAEMGGGSDPLNVSLEGRSYSPEASLVISNFLRAFSDRITTINFRGILDGLTEQDPFLVLERLVSGLEEAPLVSMDLSDMALGNVAILHILRPLLTKNTLRVLYLKNTGLGEDSMEVLSNFLITNNVPLELLHCSRNASDVGGAEYFAAIIRGVKTLQDIEYSECRAGTEASEAIADALKARGNHDDRNQSRTPLTHINLEGAMFSVDCGAFDVLVAALRKLVHLQYVNLYDCEIHESGREKIARILERINGIEIVLGEEDEGSDEEEAVFEDFSQMHL